MRLSQFNVMELNIYPEVRRTRCGSLFNITLNKYAFEYEI